jgi:poly-gamma-glutamate capsule biosynthesis protein CapA/YwtB (metallophosphatase superfamily)
MLARSVGARLVSQGPMAPFADVAHIFLGADLLAGNLECVITDVGTPEPKAYVFRAPPQAAESLRLAGFDVVSLANNHSLDYGIDGLADMLPRLREAGIASVGAGADDVAAHAPAIFVRNELRIAFLAYVDVPIEGRTGFDTMTWRAGPFKPGVAWAHIDAIRQDVKAARALADIVVVFMHFGLEGRREASTSQQMQARAAIDAGAALVIGAHAHVLQPVESYNGGLIAYSLGNFVFDGFAMPANHSAIMDATLTAHGVVDLKWIPVVLEQGLPRPAKPDEAAAIMQYLTQTK